MDTTGRLGRHVGIGTGLPAALIRARAAGYEAAQVFPGNPTGWRHVPLTDDASARARGTAQAHDIAPIVIHAPYIINLATPDEDLAAKSMRGVVNAMDRAGEIGASYVIVHAGSHKGDGEAVGIARMARAVEAIVSTARADVTLLIENSAGAGNVLAGSSSALGRLLSALPRNVGACIDTAHLWGSGASIDDRDGVEGVLDELDHAVGLERVRVLHVNDSAVALASRRDVHAHLGEGSVGLVGLSAWMTHAALAGRPLILETPEETDPHREALRCAIACHLRRGDVEGAAAVLHGLQSEQAPLAATDVADSPPSLP